MTFKIYYISGPVFEVDHDISPEPLASALRLEDCVAVAFGDKSRFHIYVEGFENYQLCT